LNPIEKEEILAVNSDIPSEPTTQNSIKKEKSFDQITNTVTKPESDIHCRQIGLCMKRCLDRCKKDKDRIFKNSMNSFL
jgi:hypothetical protein